MKKNWWYIVLFLLDSLGFLYFIPIWNFRSGMHCLAEGHPIRLLFSVFFGAAAILMLITYLLKRLNTGTRACRYFTISANVVSVISLPIFIFFSAFLIMDLLGVIWFPAQE